MTGKPQKNYLGYARNKQQGYKLKKKYRQRWTAMVYRYSKISYDGNRQSLVRFGLCILLDGFDLNSKHFRIWRLKIKKMAHSTDCFCSLFPHIGSPQKSIFVYLFHFILCRTLPSLVYLKMYFAVLYFSFILLHDQMSRPIEH